MAIYLTRTATALGNQLLVVDAKSETAARLHITKNTTVQVIGAMELAQLVMDGVKVERAAKEAEATDERR